MSIRLVEIKCQCLETETKIVWKMIENQASIYCCENLKGLIKYLIQISTSDELQNQIKILDPQFAKYICLTLTSSDCSTYTPLGNEKLHNPEGDDFCT